MAKARYNNVLLDTDDTLLLLIDHQTGLLQTVHDISVAELCTNVAVLARVATLTKVPVITTASVPDGPNGPLMPEIQNQAPHANFIARKGEINAWDNDDFVQAVRDSGKKTLVMAGIWTSVCVAFPALSALAAGYKVYAVMDASGDVSQMASHTTVMRLTKAGVTPTSTNAVVAELQKTWNRPDASQFAEIYGEMVPSYRAVIDSHRNARAAVPGRRK